MTQFFRDLTGQTLTKTTCSSLGKRKRLLVKQTNAVEMERQRKPMKNKQTKKTPQQKKKNPINSSLDNTQDKAISTMHQELLACSQKHLLDTELNLNGH